MKTRYRSGIKGGAIPFWPNKLGGRLVQLHRAFNRAAFREQWAELHPKKNTMRVLRVREAARGEMRRLRPLFDKARTNRYLRLNPYHDSSKDPL